MDSKIFKPSRRWARFTAYAALAGLMIYGAVGRAWKTPAAGSVPPEPVWKTAGDVKIRATFSQTKVLQGTDGLVYLQVDLEAPEALSAERGRKPTDFVIVLDRSGSMADARKIDYAHRAIESLIRQLKEGDRFALVGFDSRVETPVPLTEVGEVAKRRFIEKLATLNPRDGTNLGAGLLAGIDEIRSAQGRASGRAQRLILLSDGLANEGITDQGELGRIAARAAGGSFAISTIGVGLDFNENLLASLADHGSGNYHFLEELGSLDKVLAMEFNGASKIYANGLKIKLDLDPEVSVIEASGYPVEREAGAFVIKPGHLYGGQRKTLFVTLRLPTDRTYTKSLGRASISYDVKDKTHTISLFEPSFQVACLPPSMRPEVVGSIDKKVHEEAWTQNNYGRTLKDSAEMVKSGNRAGALLKIQEYKAALNEAYAAAPTPAMRQKLDEVGRLEGEVNDAFTGPDQDAKAKRLSKGYQSQGIKEQRTSK